MEDYPKTIMEFENKFRSEEDCQKYLIRLRWPDGFMCPQCQHEKAWRTSRGLFHCTNCDFETSVTAGTIFHGTRKPLQWWFRAMWYITNQKYGVSALGLQRALGLGSYHTAWTWMHKLRRAMVRPGRDRLDGIVEVDETYIGGGKPGKRGRGAAGKVLVVIAVQLDDKRIGRIRLQRVPDASGKSLEKAVGDTVALSSIVRTDGWNGYSRLGTKGFVHEIARQEAEVGDNLLPKCNIVASLLKRWLLGTHHGAVQASHLDYYLDEFTFRFNRRTSGSRGKLFFRLVQQAVAIDPVPRKYFVS
jgi:transposase-like protein/ribosomal protein L37AE/L43A